MLGENKNYCQSIIYMNLGKNMAKELGPLLLPIFSSHILLLYVIQAL